MYVVPLRVTLRSIVAQRQMSSEIPGSSKSNVSGVNQIADEIKVGDFVQHVKGYFARPMRVKEISNHGRVARFEEGGGMAVDRLVKKAPLKRIRK